MLTLKTAFAARREILLAYAIAISGGLILTAYFVKGVMLHDWYHPLYLLPIYLGLLMLDRCASNSGARSVFCEVSLIYLLAIPWLGLTNQVNQSVHGYDDWQRRVQLYRIVGRELSTILPNGKLLTGEIGALGYEYRGQILDAIGLASPVAVKYHPLKVPEERSSPGFGAIPVGYVNEVNPDVVVGFNFQVEGFRRSKTIENYRTFTCVDQTGSVTADAILGTLWIFINQNTGIVTLPPEICGAGYQF